jgi:hypothetical protein
MYSERRNTHSSPSIQDFVLIRIQFENEHLLISKDRNGNWRPPGGRLPEGIRARAQALQYVKASTSLEIPANALVEVRANVARGYGRNLHVFRVNLGVTAYEHCRAKAEKDDYLEVIPLSAAPIRLTSSDVQALFSI